KEEVRRFVIGFDRGIWPRLTTPRAAKRYINAVEFVAGLSVGELNRTDMLLLEGLRTFYPVAYEGLHGSRALLLGKEHLFDFRDDRRREEENRKSFEALLQRFAEPDQDSVVELLG